MRVKIIHPFTIDSASGHTSYKPGEIVLNGQKNWIDKGLAVEDKEPAPKAETKSAD